jgi:formylglycine-generating enzyme required for sulfatase activity
VNRFILFALAILGILGICISGNSNGASQSQSPTTKQSPSTRTNTIGMTLVYIPPGSFLMGSPADEAGRRDNETQHKVTLTKGFFMGTSHVTVGQFAAFVKATGYQTDAEKKGYAPAWTGEYWSRVNGTSWRSPGFDQADDHPVVEISWNDATSFCRWLSNKEKQRYRLPTEAEWEYAARAGTQTTYWWGNNPDDGAGCANCLDQTWKQKHPQMKQVFNWSDGYLYTSPVMKFKPNAWGLYDMIGNACEWCNDYSANYPNGQATDPRGPGNGKAHVTRGGSWYRNPSECRCASRALNQPDNQMGDLGFRVVLDAK